MAGSFSATLKILEDYNGAITAVATVFVAAFTAVLYRATNRQAILTRQSIELSRQEYISTHRPRLSVRHIIPILIPGEPIEIRCTVTNVGETTARLESQRIIVTAFPFQRFNANEEIKPAEPVVSDIYLLMSDLVGGQSEIFTTQRATNFPYSEDWQLGRIGGGSLHVRGEFLYLDENNVARRLGFSRSYNPQTGRFSSMQDEDEYQD